MPRVIAVASPEEFAAQLNEKPSFGGNKGVVVDFTAAWCGPCKMFGPIFDAMSDQYPSVTFLKVDVDELQEVAQKCQIRSMPTCQAYVNASKVDEFVGADRRALTAMLDKVASQVASGGAGLGRKLGGDSPSAPEAAGTSSAAAAGGDEAAVRRARMAAAAEARMKSAAAP